MNLFFSRMCIDPVVFILNMVSVFYTILYHHINMVLTKNMIKCPNLFPDLDTNFLDLDINFPDLDINFR